MSGLDDRQWTMVEERLGVIDTMAAELKDVNRSVNRLQIEIAEVSTSLFGVNKTNGMNAQVKKNAQAIQELKDLMPRKPDETVSKKVRGWIPVIVCVLLFLGSLYTWIESSVTKNINQQTATIQANPTP